MVTGSRPRGRPREFDADEVLDRVVEVFWARGYAATSITDLQRATRLGRASLYQAFGDKHALYLAALDRYRRREGDRLYAGLPEDAPVLPAVRGLLQSLRADIAADADHRGCFVVNAACERIPGDPDVHRRIADQFAMLERRLAQLLERGARSGELPADVAPRAAARFLVTVIQGMRVVGRAAAGPDLLDDVVEQTLRALVPRPA